MFYKFTAFISGIFRIFQLFQGQGTEGFRFPNAAVQAISSFGFRLCNLVC